MKLIKSVTNNGVKRVTIDVPEGHAVVSINPKSHYKLGYPMGEIIHADQLMSAMEVTWCVVEQRWVP